MSFFVPTELLIPKVSEMEKWSVIACDQFTSQPEYWKRVETFVGDSPSALQMICPEADFLKKDRKDLDLIKIRKKMEEYLESGLFQEYQDSFVYTERTISDGSVRKGIVGAVDLNAYDASKNAASAVRATEKTVAERIPSRKNLRRQAVLELSHSLLFADDEENLLWDYLESVKELLPVLYDFELMEGGGHIVGRLVSGTDAQELIKKLDRYEDAVREKYAELKEPPILYAVADGNHSLAAAKALAQEHQKNAVLPGSDRDPAGYALAELVNVHDPAQKFYPIHRIIKDTDPELLLETLEKEKCTEQGIPLNWYMGEKSGTVFLDPEKGVLAVGILQEFLDDYLAAHQGTMDYIHEKEVLYRLSKEKDSIGFELPKIEKKEFFQNIAKMGALPKKTFSLGHAVDKRYYLEVRKMR